MELLLSGLAASLAVFFEARSVLICLSEGGGGEDDRDWSDHMAISSSSMGDRKIPFRFGSPGDLLLGDGGPTLVVCDGITLWSRTLLSREIVWLVPESAIREGAVHDEKYFSLETNIITHKFKMPNSFVLRETYAIRGILFSSAVTQEFGRWSEGDGLVVPSPVIWERRSNLRGILLVNAMTEWPPYLLLEGNKTTGFMPDVLKMLSEFLNFR